MPERMKASVVPSGETAAFKSPIGSSGWVSWRFSSVFTDTENNPWRNAPGLLSKRKLSWKSTVAPSAVQVTPLPESESFRSGPPTCETTKTPPSSPLREKAISDPSGDHAGSAVASAVVKRRRSSLSTALMYRPGEGLFGGPDQKNTTMVPSGDRPGGPLSPGNEASGRNAAAEKSFGLVE
jgi:hypothetical protein